MAKTLLAVCVLLSLTCAVKAQSTKSDLLINPFANLAFANAYKDTVTLSGTYTGELGTVSESSLLTMMQINKLYGLNLKKLQKAIGISLNGYARKLYVPYTGNNASMLSSAKQDTPVRVKCTVYRFFTLDGVANFFYVDKVF